MKRKDKIEWLPPELATEYDRLACQLFGSGGKITEKYEKKRGNLFFLFPAGLSRPENWSLHRVIYISPFERIQKINKK